MFRQKRRLKICPNILAHSIMKILYGKSLVDFLVLKEIILILLKEVGKFSKSRLRLPDRFFFK